jgi:SAM-dependent methyltransferase
MPEAHRLARPAHSAKYERPAFRRDRLGPFTPPPRAGLHNPRRRLRRRTNGEQTSCGSDGGNVYGLDHSSASVAVASTTSRDWIKKGRVDIREGSVSQVPFATSIFDLVVAVETHFWWPDLPGNLREMLRVLKPCGTSAIIAEVYRGAESRTARLVEEYLPMTGMKFLSPEEHRQLLTDAGYKDAQVIGDAGKGWIFARGRKSFEAPNADSI